MSNITQRIAQQLKTLEAQVAAAVKLLGDGATVPFIARYRKEATGGLDDAQLRLLEERLGYLRELEERRATILRSIGEQGKLTEELKRDIQNAESKTRLEDLYLPYYHRARSGPADRRQGGGAERHRQGGGDYHPLSPRAEESVGPVDRSSVHPEYYPLVERIIDRSGLPIDKLLGNRKALQKLQPAEFTNDQFGLPTVRDILQELEKPGRDPRPEFKTARFKEGVETITDLKPEMILEGVITNVTNFGAFVDIGVHQDGLVHISNLSNKFVKDPREVVKAGDLVKVKVMELDIERRRIGLTLRLDDPVETIRQQRTRPQNKQTKTRQPQQSKPLGSSLANAFAKARKGDRS